MHTDLGFGNAIWDGERMWLLDREWACMAPIDYELLWILGSSPPSTRNCSRILGWPTG